MSGDGKSLNQRESAKVDVEAAKLTATQHNCCPIFCFPKSKFFVFTKKAGYDVKKAMVDVARASLSFQAFAVERFRKIEQVARIWARGHYVTPYRIIS